MYPASMSRMEPADVGGLLDRVFKMYLGNFAQMVGTLAIVYVPYVALTMFWQRVLMHEGSLGGMALGLLAMLVWTFVFMPLGTGATTYAVSERYLGRRISIGQSYSRASGRLLTIVGSGFLVGLVVTLGFVLFCVPGVLFMLSYAVVIPVVVLDGLGVTASMDRSKSLAEGHRGRVFLVLLVLWLLYGILMIGSVFASIMVVGPMQPGQSPPLILEVVQNIIALLATPLFTIAAVILYYDLRVRKEGFDLEMLSRALSPTPAIPLGGTWQPPTGAPQPPPWAPEPTLGPPQPPQGPTF